MRRCWMRAPTTTATCSSCSPPPDRHANRPSRGRRGPIAPGSPPVYRRRPQTHNRGNLHRERAQASPRPCEVDMKTANDQILEVRSLPTGQGTVIVALTGEVDLSSAPVLKRELEHLREAGTRHIVIDATAPTFLDSSR